VRVVVDATPTLLRSAGVKTYLYNWILALQRNASPHDLSLYPFLQDLGPLQHEKANGNKWVNKVRLISYGIVNAHEFLQNQVLGGPDVFHVSQQIQRRPEKTRFTTTLYDMTCSMMPETHTPENVKATAYFSEQIMKRAAGTISISESSRQDAIRLLGMREDKITVIHPGVSESFFRVPEEAKMEMRRQYGLNRPYVLYVGTIEPRKNIDLLLEAWESIWPSMAGEFELVLAGPQGWCRAETMARLHAGTHGTRYLGYIPEDHLPALTAGAAVFAYPSLYEGFGLPLAQAMAAGVPAITSNCSSMPEVSGDTAILVDPRSTAELSAALRKFLLSPAVREDYGRRAAERASLHFRWDVAARKAWKFFETVAG
jgi:glycosyltransferase involved in cell wall biosynthesis